MPSGRGEERDAREITRLYDYSMREGAIGLGGPRSSVRDSTLQDLNISERVAAYKTHDKNKIAYIDDRDEEHRRWKACHRNARKYPAMYLKQRLLRTITLLNTLTRLST